jgi:uncharacterized membrane protein
MEKTKKITLLGIGVALYVVLSMIANIPLVGHMRLDCGYIVYAVYLVFFGYLGIPVGVIGCFIKGYISDGWIPFTWMIGQVIIGVICSYVFRRNVSKIVRIITIFLSVFLGIAIVSSCLSALMFHLPLGLKILKGCVGALADSIAMVIGLYVADLVAKGIKGDGSKGNI